jgi:coenzyme F420-0:L-glutamate ligase/coenzyme F420-1:gamma-L-glutamate ligase
MAHEQAMIEVHPIHGVPEVRPGDDVAALLWSGFDALRMAPQDGDIVVVTQKIVSKAEGRFRRLSDVTPSDDAHRLAHVTGKDARLVELVLRESSAVVRAAPNVLVARHKLGMVLANAGIDRSNLGGDAQDLALLLPADPDASARGIGEALSARAGGKIGVVISDSFGRPWRLGVVNVAIGAWGVPSLIDRRGDMDRDGRRLEVTQIAIGDLLASTAGLAMGEAAEGIPAAIVRGCAWKADAAPASTLLRPIVEDLFQ